MTYETAIEELLIRLPALYPAYLEEIRDEAGTRREMDFVEVMFNMDFRPLSIFYSVLIPSIKAALDAADFETVKIVCTYLEEVSVGARSEPNLQMLMNIIGEWLEYTPYELKIAPWLGPETRRATSYIEGLATQRLEIQAETRARSLTARLSRLLQKLKLKK